ncbi:hypothetical protein IGI04_002769 [Brassica rapa subsp. trilocularis]|uniref:Uncharacterized protein n=1 Tax=Brassica rapa subsp. trilocularis TaxID=1813537 RepID=A0ABQ7NWH2_BRACM|nr:hypothetical protein IGI04_002769 [Brassica rapa subsp. trilocularis]
MLQEASQNYVQKKRKKSKPKLRFGDAPFTIRFESCSHYVIIPAVRSLASQKLTEACAQTGSYVVIVFPKQKKSVLQANFSFCNLIMNYQTFCEVIDDNNSSAQGRLNTARGLAAFQVVWMGGVVNSTRSNRFSSGLNTTHVAAFFYSSTAGAYHEPWVSTTAVTRYVISNSIS